MRAQQFIFDAARTSSDTISKMIRDYEAGYNYSEIGRILSIKYDTVRKYIEQQQDFERMKRKHETQRKMLLKLRPQPSPPPPHKDTDIIMSKYKEGQSEDTIGSSLGLSRQKVRSIIQSHPEYQAIRAEHDKNVTSYSDRSRSYSSNPKDEADIVQKYLSGIPANRIAKEYGITARIVDGILRRQPDYATIRAEHEKIVGPKNKLADPAVMQEFIKAYINGANTPQLAAQFGISGSFAWKTAMSLPQNIQSERVKAAQQANAAKQITEVFDTKIQSLHKPEHDSENYFAQARIGGRIITFDARYRGQIWYVSFRQEKKPTILSILRRKGDIKKIRTSSEISSQYSKTGSGYEFQVFSFVLQCIADLIRKYRPQYIRFSASQAERNRVDLYTRMVARFAKRAGYRYSRMNHGPFEVIFTLQKSDDFYNFSTRRQDNESL